MRFLCQVSSTGSFLRFHRRLLCSIALNHLPPCGGRRISPALSFLRSRGTRDPTLLALSFHLQFAVWDWIQVIAGSGLRIGRVANFTPRFRSSS